MQVSVALRGGRGRRRPGRAVLTLVGKAAGRGGDTDRVILVCLPGR